METRSNQSSSARRARAARRAGGVHRLAGRPVEPATSSFDIFFHAVGRRPQQGHGVTFSGVPVGQIESIYLLPDRPEFVRVRISVDEETPVLQGTTATDQGRRLHRRLRDPARRSGQGRTAPQPGRAAGLPGHPDVAGRARRAAQQRAGAARPGPALTERLTELLSDKNQNSIAGILDNIEETTASSPSARRRSPTRSPRRGSRPARPASPPSGSACSPTAPAGWSTSRAGPPPRICARRSHRSSGPGYPRRHDRRRPAGRPEFLEADAARGQSAGARPARPVESLRGVSERLDQGGVGGVLGRQKLARLQAGKDTMMRLTRLITAPIAALASCRLLRRRQGAAGAADADARSRRAGRRSTPRGERRRGGHDRDSDHCRGTADDARARAGRRRPRSPISRTCNGSRCPTGCSRTAVGDDHGDDRPGGARPQAVILDPGVQLTGQLQRFGFDARRAAWWSSTTPPCRRGGSRSRPAASRRACRPTGTAANGRPGAQPGRQPGRDRSRPWIGG